MTTSNTINVGLTDSLATVDAEPFSWARTATATPSSEKTRDCLHTPREQTSPMVDTESIANLHQLADSNGSLNVVDNCLLAIFGFTAGFVAVILTEMMATLL